MGQLSPVARLAAVLLGLGLLIFGTGCQWLLMATQLASQPPRMTCPTPTPLPNIPLSEATDCPYLVWDTAGHGPWFGQANVTHDGVDAAQSYPISHNQYSRIFTTATGPDTLRFSWRTSSEPVNDWFMFLLDGVEQTRISGETDWQMYEIQIPAGDHALNWFFHKNDSVSQGLDCAWLDEVRLLSQTSANGLLFR